VKKKAMVADELSSIAVSHSNELLVEDCTPDETKHDVTRKKERR
jgi:hypothetical protein